MDARTKRTIYRLVALFLAAGAGDAIVQFAVGSTSYDYRHLAGALVAAAVMAGEQFLKETDSTTSSPTVAAVTATLQTALDNSLVSVPPPKIAIPEPPVVVTLPDAQAGVPPAG